MVELSKGFRTGRLVKQYPEGIFKTESSEEHQFIAIQLESTIPIGFGEVSEETTNVLLIGDAVVAWWKTMLPSPKIGDTVRVSYATMYLKNGVLCMRVQDPSNLEVLPQSVSEAAPGIDTFKSINATDFFHHFFEEKKIRTNN